MEQDRAGPAVDDSCRWCGQAPHGGLHCPLIKALDFDPLYGGVTRVEFLTPADYPKADPIEPQRSYPRKQGVV